MLTAVEMTNLAVAWVRVIVLDADERAVDIIVTDLATQLMTFVECGPHVLSVLNMAYLALKPVRLVVRNAHKFSVFQVADLTIKLVPLLEKHAEVLAADI